MNKKYTNISSSHDHDGEGVGEIDITTNESYNDDANLDDDSVDASKRLRDKLRTCEQERREYLDGWQRSKADFINQRKSFEAERARIVSNANENLILDLVPALDSFAMAMGNTEAWERVDKDWRMGVEYIHGQIVSALSANGLSIIEPRIGDEFDPTRETCVSKIPSGDDFKAHTVTAILQKGYMLGDRVIRPARVAVAFDDIKETPLEAEESRKDN